MCASLVGCSTPHVQGHAQLLSPVTAPKDLNDLLRRIKAGLMNDVFLQPDFATEPNLLRFFGAQEVAWLNTTPPKSGSLSGFGSSIAPMRGPQYDPEGFTIHFAFNSQQEPIPNAYLGLFFRETVQRVQYAELVKVFGSAWKPVTGRLPEIPNPHRIFMPPTDPHGNEKVDLDLSDASVLRSVHLEFDENGALWFMAIVTLRR